VPLCPPKIPHYLTWDGTRGEKSATNRLSYGTAILQYIRIRCYFFISNLYC
jgi:hypothetical protein